MKRVTQLAEELGVSRQTIYYHRKKLGEKVKDHFTKENNTLYVDEQGIKLIKESMSSKEEVTQESTDSQQDKEKEQLKERVKELKEDKQELREQIKKKDEQIEMLNIHLQQSQTMLQEKEEEVLELEGEVQEQGVISRIKSFFTGSGE